MAYKVIWDSRLQDILDRADALMWSSMTKFERLIWRIQHDCLLVGGGPNVQTSCRCTWCEAARYAQGIDVGGLYDRA
jgi:hypothetical protein